MTEFETAALALLERIAAAVERTPKRRKPEQGALVATKLSAKDLVEGYLPTPAEMRDLAKAHPAVSILTELANWRDRLRNREYKSSGTPPMPVKDAAASFRYWLSQGDKFRKGAPSAKQPAEFRPAEVKRV